MKITRKAIKELAQGIMPPVMFRGMISILGVGITLRGKYGSWAEASSHSATYDADFILEKVRSALLQVKRGEAAFERDSVLFDEIQYSHPVLAGLLRAALSSGGSLSVLDFGGSLGSSYYQNRQLLYGLRELRWSVVEQKRFVAVGRAQFEDDTLRFYYSIAECLQAERPNVVLLSSVLQYLENPQAILEQILCSGIEYLIIDMLPIHQGPNDLITVQHVPKRIYAASYPFRIFAERAVLNDLLRKYEQVLAFDTLELPALRGFAAKYQGYLLRRRTAQQSQAER
jgi:putative methyltransferase (TIGR04325 family)